MKNKELEIKDIWNEKKKAELKEFVSSHSRQQSKERLLVNKLLSIQYRMEDYIRNEDEPGDELSVLDFVKMYLEALHITKKDLAQYFDMKDSNLHKYLSGERKLNAELAMKLSSFTHTKPEQWFGIQVKNEMIKLKREKKDLEAYKKYDFRNLIDAPRASATLAQEPKPKKYKK